MSSPRALYDPVCLDNLRLWTRELAIRTKIPYDCMEDGVPRLKIKQFNPASMKPYANVVVLGKKGTGKTTLIKDLLYYCRDIPAGCVISGSEEANGFYKEMVPSILIKHEFKTEHVRNLLQRQRHVIENDNKNVDPRVFLIFDDCLYDSSWAKDKEVRRVMMNGRHYFTNFYIAMQYPLGIPPNLRTNIDYVFILRENIRANRERIYKSYAGIFPSYNVFEQVVNKLTTNYGALVIDNTSSSNNLFDCIFWYKAEIRGKFKLCSEALWRLDESYKQQREKEKNTEEDKEDELLMMRKAPRVYVQKLMHNARS